MSVESNNEYPLLGGVIVVLAAVLSYSPLLFGGGWFSDDYMQVYGLHGQPLPSVEESVREAGAGSVSVARTFSRVQMGYGGFFLGEYGAMAVRLAGHALNAWLLLLVLGRLAVIRALALGTALVFATAPWHTQAVAWWATVHLGLAISLTLLALLMYQSWLERGAWWRLGISQLLVFASAMTYEQVLASWLIFFGVALLQSGHLKDSKSMSCMRAMWKALSLSWPMLIPFVLWTVLYLATFPFDSGTRAPRVALDRNLMALASTHFRWFDSVWRIPWADLWKQGMTSITLFAAALMGLFTIGAVWLLGWLNDRAKASPMPVASLFITLAFSYLLFAGFRLVFVLQGATSTETRNSYGADMGVALAIAAVAYFLFASKLRRPLLYALVVTSFCLLNMIITRGEAWHVARNAEDEKAVFEAAVDALSKEPANKTLAVIVTKTLSNGEKDFYEEFDGGWLEYRLEKKLGRKINVEIQRDGLAPASSSAVVELK